MLAIDRPLLLLAWRSSRLEKHTIRRRVLHERGKVYVLESPLPCLREFSVVFLARRADGVDVLDQRGEKRVENHVPVVVKKRIKVVVGQKLGADVGPNTDELLGKLLNLQNEQMSKLKKRRKARSPP